MLARELLSYWLRAETRRSVLAKLKRLFVIKTRFEAYLIIFALALGAMTRGAQYTLQYPGVGGYLLFAATAGAVFLGGAKILDALRYEREARDAGEKTADSPAVSPAEPKWMKEKVGVSVASYPRSPGIRFCCPVGPTAL